MTFDPKFLVRLSGVIVLLALGGATRGAESEAAQAMSMAAHAVSETEGGHVARNSGQQWRTQFDGRGFSIEPDAGAWTWGLELTRYGFSGAALALDGDSPNTRASGSSLSYTWDETLEEWYRNDGRGLEHGYTVIEPPPRGDDPAAPLEFELAVRGGLTPVIDADGLGARFVDDEGATRVTYAGLLVQDATGRSVPARMERSPGGLSLSVDARDARYPLTVDPIAQQAYIKASNTDPGDQFGWSVSMSGDTLVVGAKVEDGGATGVNGNQTNGSLDSGAAYVFVRTGTTWSQQAYLKASNTGDGHQFGYSVGISGDTIVVGAPYVPSGTNSSFKDGGAAYVFVRSGSTWSQQAYLEASNTEQNDRFGAAVSISGETIVVGADGEDGNSPGVNGNAADNSLVNSGAAYVYVRNGTTWSEQAYLKASHPDSFDRFGWAVAVSGDVVVVGSPFESSAAVGVDGDGSNNGSYWSGAAFVFARSGTTWTQQAYLKAPNAGFYDVFGRSVAVSGERVVIGAPFEDSGASGVDGDGNDDGVEESGAAYVFARSGTTWSPAAYLKSAQPAKDHLFGHAVAVDGETVAVGPPYDAAGGGSVYVYTPGVVSWIQQARLSPPPTPPAQQFGWSVSVSEESVAVGSPGDRSSATGVDGDPYDIGALNSGAARVFSVPCGATTTYGTGCTGSGGFVPTLAAGGCATLGGTLQLAIEDGPGGAPIALFVGSSATSVPIGGGCSLLVSSPFVLAGLTLPGSGPGAGALTLTLPLPPAAPLSTITVQAAVADATSPLGFTTTNGMQLDMQ